MPFHYGRSTVSTVACLLSITLAGFTPSAWRDDPPGTPFYLCDNESTCSHQANCNVAIGPVDEPPVDLCLEISLTNIGFIDGDCEVQSNLCRQKSPCGYWGSITFTLNCQLPGCSPKYKITDNDGNDHVLRCFTGNTTYTMQLVGRF